MSFTSIGSVSIEVFGNASWTGEGEVGIVMADGSQFQAVPPAAGGGDWSPMEEGVVVDFSVLPSGKP